MKLTIVGLGPGHPDDMTRRAWRILQETPEVYLRTARHPAISALERSYESFDSLYDRAENFENLYETIAEKIFNLAKRPEGVVYAVPGHPLVGEQTVTLLLEKAKAHSLPVEIVDGISFIEPSLSLLGIDGITGLQIHDAAEIARMYHPPLNPDFPALLAQLYSQPIASDVKLTLMNQYPDEHSVILIHGAGTPGGKTEAVAMYEIDRSPHLAHMTTLYIPPLERASSFERFQETIAHLRSPEGCPWDREQTHQSLRPYLLEETYEVIEALDNKNWDALREELGDLLLQVVLHSQVGIDEGNFTMAEIVEGINAKIIRRHPHVWGDEVVHTTDDLKKVWQKKKQEEKESSDKPADREKKILDDVPKALPALAQAVAYQKKAARVGFDWDKITPVIEKVHEEIQEIQQTSVPDEQAAEMGDLLFAIVNWARWLKVEPETALREANQRFRRRFEHIEQRLSEQGKQWDDVSLADMDALWDEAKKLGK